MNTSRSNFRRSGDLRQLIFLLQQKRTSHFSHKVRVYNLPQENLLLNLTFFHPVPNIYTFRSTQNWGTVSCRAVVWYNTTVNFNKDVQIGTIMLRFLGLMNELSRPTHTFLFIDLIILIFKSTLSFPSFLSILTLSSSLPFSIL